LDSAERCAAANDCPYCQRALDVWRRETPRPRSSIVLVNYASLAFVKGAIPPLADEDARDD
jgi:hypothetical protein